MVSKLLKKVFGSRNDRMLKGMRKTVATINALEPEMEALSEEALRGKTEEFRKRLADGETLDSLLPEAFAVAREGSKRCLGMRHFDVQLIGGMVLNQNQIAEMRTGEGKTLVATLPAYLNALTSRGVHVITVNDYLATRDAQWMGQLYAYLGLTTGVAVAGMNPDQKRAAYAADITYGTNNEFGFDYLRDNMAFSLEQKVQRELHYAVIDEVDSILIDEARTPLIISGPAEESSELYRQLNELIPRLEPQTTVSEDEEIEAPGDYSVDEKAKQASLTEQGHETTEQLLTEAGLLNEGESLYDAANLGLFHHLNACLRAHVLFQKDVDYIVSNGQIVIVDEFTGRTMAGRRWSEGLHQAIEAKEGVPIQAENHTLASITFQNYFRMYEKLSGMTGTADTEAYEFQQIYGLEVVVIPTHMDMVRDDKGDLIYLTATEKYDAVIEDIQDCSKRGQPVLVGTTSIEVSEYLSGLLDKAQVKHEVLNAKQHEREADIIAQAGSMGAVTIATNMAGRGTDIVLGGNMQSQIEALGEDADESARALVESAWKDKHQDVLNAGGLHIIGTERHESRRIDNQLRGRSGRQGDPGSTRFYLSLEDSLMRIFASDRVSGLMQRLGMEDGEAIEHPWVTKAIENAQRKVEAHNFDIRKQLLEFDDVNNDQRKVVYGMRHQLLEATEVSETIDSMRKDVVGRLVTSHIPKQSLPEQWDLGSLREEVQTEFGAMIEPQVWLDEDPNITEDQIREKVEETLSTIYAEKKAQVPEDAFQRFEKSVVLDQLDSLWKDHLAAMDYLRQGIHLRGYAQKNPKQEYKRESFEMFQVLLERIQLQTTSILAKVQIQMEPPPVEEPPPQPDMQFEHEEFSALGETEAETGTDQKPGKEQPFVREDRKVGRNEPCPCGSGKKYKQCHGRLA